MKEKDSTRTETFRWLLAALFVGALALPAPWPPAMAAQGIAPEDFARWPDMRRARFSPDGEHLAVLRVVDDKRVVAVMSFPEMKLTGTMSFPGSNQVLSYWWVNNERLIGSVTRDFGTTEYLLPTGELFGMNADGSRGRHLFGLRAGDRSGPSATQTGSRAFASAEILSYLWDEPDTVLIQIRNWSGSFNQPVEAARMNVYNGRITARIRAPATGAQLLADSDGIVRYAFSTDDDFNSLVHRRDPETGDWRLFSKVEYGQSQIQPIAFADDGRIYVRTAPDEGPLGIYLMHPETQEMEPVYRHEYVDADLLLDDEDTAWGVHIEPDYPQLVPLLPEHPHAVLLAGLREIFPGRYVYIIDYPEDQELFLIGVQDDNATPEVYLYDAEKRRLNLFFDVLPWIDDGLLAEMRPIEIEARDGLTLHGYLTLPPPALEGGDLPLVVIPHGGPHGPRDTWGYDPYGQILATHGYAVLQVNYRGSGGYGPHFEKLGFREWGRKMQDDVTDATHWAIEEGIADPDRICIYGWSYGGYASMMGVIREPGLYACAVPAAGVYDQEIQYRKADFTRYSRWGERYIDRVIGPTAEDRRLASPVTYVDRIKTPLFLVHGEEDQRVPVEHARALMKALERVGIEAEYMEKRNEGHGFFKEENRVDFFKALLRFLDTHIGSGLERGASGEVASAGPAR